MRRTAARIGVVAALALSMGMAAVNAPSARAEEPGLVSATRANTDERNYAINLVGTNPELRSPDSSPPPGPTPTR